MRKWVGVGFLLLLGWLLAFTSLRWDSISVDEPTHFDYGRRALEGKFEFRNWWDGAKMPVSVLNVLPVRLVRPEWLARCPQCPEAIRLGRHVTLLFSVLLGLLIFCWAEKLYGTAAGFLALMLFTFSPNLLAHRRYVTTDLYVTLMFFASFYSLWSFERFGGWLRGMRTALLAGIALVVKISAFWLYPIIAMIFAVQSSRRDKPGGMRLKNAAGWLALFALTAILVVNAVYLFKGSFTPLRQYSFFSSTMKSAQKSPLLRDVAVPLPHAWVSRVDEVLYVEETGDTYGPLYFFGQYQNGKEKKGFKGYYFAAYLLKEPLGAQILFLLALFFYLKRRKEFRFWNDEIFLAAPVIFFAVYLNFFFKTQTGIRYALPVFPLIYVFTASLLKNGAAINRRLKICTAGLLLYMVISVMSYYPFFLPYFNEIVWDRSTAYRYLFDSNVVWGDQFLRLQAFLKTQPGHYIFNPKAPVSGKIILDLWSYFFDKDRAQMDWLVKNYRPKSHIAYAYWIYDTRET